MIFDVRSNYILPIIGILIIIALVGFLIWWFFIRLGGQSFCKSGNCNGSNISHTQTSLGRSISPTSLLSAIAAEPLFTAFSPGHDNKDNPLDNGNISMNNYQQYGHGQTASINSPLCPGEVIINLDGNYSIDYTISLDRAVTSPYGFGIVVNQAVIADLGDQLSGTIMMSLKKNDCVSLRVIRGSVYLKKGYIGTLVFNLSS